MSNGMGPCRISTVAGSLSNSKYQSTLSFILALEADEAASDDVDAEDMVDILSCDDTGVSGTTGETGEILGRSVLVGGGTGVPLPRVLATERGGRTVDSSSESTARRTGCDCDDVAPTSGCNS